MCIVCIANNINRNVYMYLNTRIFPTTGYLQVLLFMFIRRELGGTGTGCLFQFTYCEELSAIMLFISNRLFKKNQYKIFHRGSRQGLQSLGLNILCQG